MSVNHFFLPVSDAELASLLAEPKSAHALIEARDAEVQTIHTQGIAITALMAEDENDPLAFLQCGGPDGECGWIGEYSEGNEEEGATCEVDLGYGPGSYYKNSFLLVVAEAISRISAGEFASHFTADWLEENHIYPGYWHEEGRREFLVECFVTLRTCLTETARSGRHLLVWCA